ncbi:MAG TPA: hypothetical protein VFD43_04885 [Planctomycetota bacterium]|nr:hypothetical protein [Planctomycetota bacterium]
MIPWKQAVLVSVGLFVVPSCCPLPEYPPEWELRVCRAHLEPPFNTASSIPGPGLVFGTADFNGSGTVLIKIQVEDLAAIPGSQATITVWSGNGAEPVAGSPTPPPGGTEVFSTSGNVPLRFYTTHLDRTYDPEDPDGYWLFVQVIHDNGDTREFSHHWMPEDTTIPDTPWDFDAN